jgi:hypothetical protein
VTERSGHQDKIQTGTGLDDADQAQCIPCRHALRADDKESSNNNKAASAFAQLCQNDGVVADNSSQGNTSGGISLPARSADTSAMLPVTAMLQRVSTTIRR